MAVWPSINAIWRAQVDRVLERHFVAERVRIDQGEPLDESRRLERQPPEHLLVAEARRFDHERVAVPATSGVAAIADEPNEATITNNSMNQRAP